MMKSWADASDLLRLAERFEETPPEITSAIARALNQVGRGVVREAADAISGKTGLDTDQVMRLIDVREAEPEHLVWEMDAQRAIIPQGDWSRPWESRDDEAFQQNELLKIITSADCCEVCADAAADSPYTAEEIKNIAAKWAHWSPPTPVSGERTNLLHPNCRCAVQPFRSMRRLPLSFGRGAPPELFTLRQLGQRVAEEVRLVIRAKLR